MLKYSLILIVLSAVSLCLSLWLLWQKSKNRFDSSSDKKAETLHKVGSSQQDKDMSVEGKIDERSLEVGDSDITAVSIDAQAQKYYQNLGDKAKQDRATELLLKAAQENNSRRLHQTQHQENHKQEQKRRQDKQNNNRRQLEKLRNSKVRKKVAKKNIELDDEQIKKIKLKALGGKMK